MFLDYINTIFKLKQDVKDRITANITKSVDPNKDAKVPVLVNPSILRSVKSYAN